MTNGTDVGRPTAAASDAQRTSIPVHPQYATMLPYWVQMEDTYKGENVIKEAGQRYLPATAAQRADGLGLNQDGLADYVAYKNRAVFYEVVGDAVRAMTGVMHRKPAVIDLPKRLEGMRERATPQGEGLQSLLRRMNEEQLINARVGLLVEVPTGKSVADAMPFIAVYRARALINWDVGVSDQGEQKIEMVALDESEWERDSLFGWKFVPKTRLLVANKNRLTGDREPAEDGYYATVLRDTTQVSETQEWIQPSVGGRTFKTVPFVFLNANDLVPDVELPQLIGLSNIALALYRGDADYRHTLYMQGQATFVMIGADDGDNVKRLGAGAIVDLPKGGDAKYVQVLADGIEGQRKALEDLLKQASDRGAKLLDFEAGNNQISGEALRVRVAARTTTLTGVAKASAEALKQLLRFCAEVVGANPDEVKVTPNLEFSDSTFTGQDLLNYVQAKNLGAPMSQETLHAMMRRRDVTDLQFEEEMELIESENPLPGSAALAEEHLDEADKLARDTLDANAENNAAKNDIAAKSAAAKANQPGQKKIGQTGKPPAQKRPAPKQNGSNKR